MPVNQIMIGLLQQNFWQMCHSPGVAKQFWSSQFVGPQFGDPVTWEVVTPLKKVRKTPLAPFFRSLNAWKCISISCNSHAASWLFVRITIFLWLWIWSEEINQFYKNCLPARIGSFWGPHQAPGPHVWHPRPTWEHHHELTLVGKNVQIAWSDLVARVICGHTHILILSLLPPKRDCGKLQYKGNVNVQTYLWWSGPPLTPGGCPRWRTGAVPACPHRSPRFPHPARRTRCRPWCNRLRGENTTRMRFKYLLL